MRSKYIALPVIALALLSGCGGSSERSADEQAATKELWGVKVTDAGASDALAQMAAVFDGGYSEVDIKFALDSALEATGMEVTEDNYRRAGSALVALSEANGLPEMAILECIPTMARAAGPGALDFPDAAALCSVELLISDW